MLELVVHRNVNSPQSTAVGRRTYCSNIVVTDGIIRGPDFRAGEARRVIDRDMQRKFPRLSPG